MTLTAQIKVDLCAGCVVRPGMATQRGVPRRTISVVASATSRPASPHGWARWPSAWSPACRLRM